MSMTLSQRVNGSASGLLALFLLCIFGAAGTANAAICRVDISGGGNGSSWAQPMVLQAALASASCSEIWVKSGTYIPGGLQQCHL